MGEHPDATAESLMEPGPSTVRAHVEAAELAERLRGKGLGTAVVTTPHGALVGVARLQDLEAAASRSD